LQGRYFNFITKQYNGSQNYWIFGLFPSFGILETGKHEVSETGSVSVPSSGEVGEKTPAQLGPLDRNNINQALSKGPN
jgi:hypothetical protein